MAKLTEEVRRFIIMELAVYRMPTEVVRRVKDEFDLEIDRRQVNDYHPERRHKEPVAKKWQKLFKEVRADFDKSAKKIPIGMKVFRLRELQENYIRARDMGNVALANETLQQAAKEMGGAFTNQRQVTGRDGGPIETRDMSHMSDEEIARRLAELTGSSEADS